MTKHRYGVFIYWCPRTEASPTDLVGVTDDLDDAFRNIKAYMESNGVYASRHLVNAVVVDCTQPRSLGCPQLPIEVHLGMEEFMTRLHAFGSGGVIRRVHVPVERLNGNVLHDLGLIFHYGQNDFCDEIDADQDCRSLSVGDTIIYRGEIYKVDRIGFSKDGKPVT